MPKIEDRKLTSKENMLRLLRGEMPEWVPVYTMGAPLEGEPAPLAFMQPGVFNDPHPKGGGYDLWGVHWVGNDETGGAILPEPGNFILEDICDWRDVLKAPDISDFDYEACAQQDLSHLHFDPEVTAFGFSLNTGTFQQLAAFMGFEGALVSMFEEPEETMACIEFFDDYYIDACKKCIDLYNPDVLVLMDDTCAEGAPFMSEELFVKFFLPRYKKAYEELAAPRDLPVTFHNCGTAARFIELCHEEAGVRSWDPAQPAPVNDLDAFKAKWGREIAIFGGFNGRTSQLLDPNCPDEVIAQAARDTIDRYAPDGGYALYGSFLGPKGDTVAPHKTAVLRRAAQEYGWCFYD